MLEECNTVILAAWFYNLKKHIIDFNLFFNEINDCFPNTINTEQLLEIIHGKAESDFNTQIVICADSLSGNYIYDASNTGSPMPMTAILSNLHLQEKEKPQAAYFMLETLSDTAVLPKTNIKISKADYEHYEKKFIQDFKKLKGLPYNEFLSAMEALFEYYWWCVPVATAAPSISVFQHAKMTAAFAGALYRYHHEAQCLTEDALHNVHINKFRFISGDMSGIQKYIFDLKIPSNNAKLLRARSFQLWALSEVVARYLIMEFQLSSANIITTAGGKFLILMQNTEKARKALQDAQIKFETYFLKEFAGALSFIISDGVESCAEDLKQENTERLINALGYHAECCKQKKMQKALVHQHTVFDALYKELQANGACAFCETFPAKTTRDEKAICTACDALIKIGEKLVKANEIIFKPEKLKEDAPFAQLVEIRQRKDRSVAAGEDVRFAAVINEFEAGKPVVYLPYTAPKDNGNEILTFEAIAEVAQGNKKLAMFKADVDNLGLLFTSSFGGAISFSKYAEMSRTLHYFFSAYLAYFIDNHYPNKIYTVFSGGDDVCVLGAWNDIMDFAYDFNEELKKATHNNPSVTLSGGITLVSASLPVRNIAEEADVQLDKSKSRKDSSGRSLKNGITIFGTTVSWEDYKTYLDYGKKLVKYMAQGVKNEKGELQKLSAGTVYKLIDFANREKKVKDGITTELVWLSNFKYLVARNIQNEEMKHLFLDFGTSETIEKSRIAASYALYAQRKTC